MAIDVVIKQSFFLFLLLVLGLMIIPGVIAQGAGDACPDVSVDIRIDSESEGYSKKQGKLVDVPSERTYECTQDDRDFVFEACKKVYAADVDAGKIDPSKKCAEACRAQSQGKCQGNFKITDFKYSDNDECFKVYDDAHRDILYRFECTATLQCDCFAPPGAPSRDDAKDDKKDEAPSGGAAGGTASGGDGDSSGASSGTAGSTTTQVCGTAKITTIESIPGEVAKSCQKRKEAKEFNEKSCGIDFDAKCAKECELKYQGCKVGSKNVKSEKRVCQDISAKKSIDACRYELECSCVKEVQVSSRASVPEFPFAGVVISMGVVVLTLFLMRRR